MKALFHEKQCSCIYNGLFFFLVEKVQKELDAILSSSHLICYEDQKKLPHTNAVIHEIMHFGSIILITIPREAAGYNWFGVSASKGTDTLSIPV